MNESTNKNNWKSAYKHFYNYTNGKCRFCDLSVPLCQKFVNYMLSDKCAHDGKKMMATTANNHLAKLKAALRKAYEEGHIRPYTGKLRQEAHPGKRTWQQARVPDQGGTYSVVEDSVQERRASTCRTILLPDRAATVRHHTVAMVEHQEVSRWWLDA